MNTSAVLIVNADDYGYFASVSRGILACARLGVVTATGVMANGPRFDDIIPWLFEFPQLDLGVHLNLTYGMPVSIPCRDHFAPLGGRFFPKGTTAGMVLRGKLPLSVVKEEWRAQIERCLKAGLTPRFLNSHEHIHILPGLFRIFLELAEEYHLTHLRFPRTEWAPWPKSISGAVRNLLFLPLNVLNGSLRRKNRVPVLGLGESGKLSMDYIRRLVPLLKSGKPCELMCHPGFYDPEEIRDSHLCGFHAWEEEMAVLTGEEFKNVLQRYQVRLQGYRGL